MKRSRGLLIAAGILLVAAVVFHFGRRPGPSPVEPAFVEPAVTEFTPAGLARFRNDLAVAIRVLPPDSYYHRLDPATDVFVRQAIKQGKAVEAYRSVEPDDRQVAYRNLAGLLIGFSYSGDPDRAFDELGRVYEQDFPLDKWPLYFRAERHARRNEWATAEPLYATAAAALPTETSVRRKWSQCLLYLGRWREAYEAGEPSRDLFGQVAASLLNDSNAAGLQELIDLHRSANPEDTEALYYQGWAHRLRRDYAAADRAWFEYGAMVELKATHSLPDSGHSSLVLAVDQKFRELAANNRIAEARVLIDHPPDDFRERISVWRAILAARKGDAGEVIRQLEAVRKAIPAHAWWHDEDLRPLLEADGMAAVRKRFPRSD